MQRYKCSWGWQVLGGTIHGAWTCTRANQAWLVEGRRKSMPGRWFWVPVLYWEWVLSLLPGKAGRDWVSILERDNFYGFGDFWIQEALAGRYKSPHRDFKTFHEPLCQDVNKPIASLSMEIEVGCTVLFCFLVPTQSWRTQLPPSENYLPSHRQMQSQGHSHPQGAHLEQSSLCKLSK